MECLADEVIFDCIAFMKQELTKGNLMNSPNQVYSLDESSPWVVALKGQKKVRYRTSGNKTRYQSASGQCSPILLSCMLNN